MIQYIKKRKAPLAMLALCVLVVVFFGMRAEKRRAEFDTACSAKGGQPVRLGFDDHQPVCAKVEIIK